MSYADALVYKNKRRRIPPAVYNERKTRVSHAKSSNPRARPHGIFSSTLATFFGNAQPMGSALPATQIQPTFDNLLSFQQQPSTSNYLASSSLDSSGNNYN